VGISLLRFLSLEGCAINKDFRVNEMLLRGPRETRLRDVRLIDENNQALGIVPVRDALNMAQERGLDLIEVAPNAQPPVCKIMDYGKYKYEQGKRENEQRKKQKQQELKSIKMRPVTAEHDYQVRLRQTLKFLEDGDKVKVTIQFKAREITHPEIGRRLLERMIADVGDHAVVERAPALEGKMLIIILGPNTKHDSHHPKEAKEPREAKAPKPEEPRTADAKPAEAKSA
jgi:translation initiation factor IF-3